MHQPYRPRQFYLVGLDDDFLALDAAQIGKLIARCQPTAVDHDAVGCLWFLFGLKFDAATGSANEVVELRHHAARLDMTFVGKEQRVAKSTVE